ncbi:MAG: diguanylate cyclase, partial [Alphaproteobacteria bacterium]
MGADQRYLADFRLNAPKIERLRDGRFILVLHVATPDGGWLMTHEDVTERQNASLKIAYLAHHDPLTKLANRTLLLERMGNLASESNHGEEVGLLLIDLDDFKSVNDNFGHDTGDALL